MKVEVLRDFLDGLKDDDADIDTLVTDAVNGLLEAAEATPDGQSIIGPPLSKTSNDRGAGLI